MVTGMLTKIDADIDVKLTQTNLKKYSARNYISKK